MKYEDFPYKETAKIVKLFNSLLKKPVKVRLKNIHPIMRLYKKKDISYIFNTIWVPSIRWLLNPELSTGLIAHEFVHKFDRERDGFLYTLRWWFSAKWRFIYEMRAFAANLAVILYFNDGVYPKEVEDQLLGILFSPEYFLPKKWKKDLKLSLMPNVFDKVKNYFMNYEELEPTNEGLRSEALILIIKELKSMKGA